jgi:hypothetical protein
MTTVNFFIPTFLLIIYQRYFLVERGGASVVDLDPVGSEPLTGSGYGKNHSGSRPLRIRNEFEVKLLWKTDKI